MSSPERVPLLPGSLGQAGLPLGNPVPSYGLCIRESNCVDEVESVASSDVDGSPNQYIKRHETTKAEIWSYCLYYVGNSGLNLAILAPIAVQNLMHLAANSDGLLLFLGKYRTVNSVALQANAIAFCLQTIILLVLGSLADYGNWRPTVLIVQSIIGIVVGLAWIGLTNPENWHLGVLTYIVGLVAFQTSIAYYYAAFPILARNTATMRKKADKLESGRITREEYEMAESKERNRISNMSLSVAGAGGVIIVSAVLWILHKAKVTASPERNTLGLSLAIAFGSGMWFFLALPWFVLEKRRPGQPIPSGTNLFTAGALRIYTAATHISKLKQTLAYLIGYFILGESLSTSVTVLGTLQNNVVSYNTITLAKLILVQYISSTLGIFACMHFQKFFCLGTKTMLCMVGICIISMNAWGFLGFWTSNIGYHQEWEFWVVGTWFGFFITPFYSYSQTMISEVTPSGKDSLFFSLFNTVGKGCAFVGPMISSSIIDVLPSHNPNAPFLFLAITTTIGLAIVIFCVDLKESRVEQRRYLEEEQQQQQQEKQVMQEKQAAIEC